MVDEVFPDPHHIVDTSEKLVKSICSMHKLYINCERCDSPFQLSILPSIVDADEKCFTSGLHVVLDRWLPEYENVLVEDIEV